MTFTQHLDTIVNEKARTIREMVRLGWSKEDAIAHVRKSSTLGPKTWERALAIVEEKIAPRTPVAPQRSGARLEPLNGRLTSDNAQGGNGIDDVLVGHADW